MGLYHADRKCETRGLVRKQRALQASPVVKDLGSRPSEIKEKLSAQIRQAEEAAWASGGLELLGLSPEPTGRGVLGPTRAHLLIW